ncbi:TPA: hypothetical protein ACGZ92_001782 [Elizabethkingia anophelis]
MADSIPPEYLLLDTPVSYTDQAPPEHFSDFLDHDLYKKIIIMNEELRQELYLYR